MTQQFKSGNEFLPFHPQASHVSPDYRDGWNACWQAAIAGHKPMTEVEAMQIVSTRPYGTLVNSLHHAIRETERFHGIGK